MPVKFQGSKQTNLRMNGIDISNAKLDGEKVFSADVATGTIVWNDPHIFMGTNSISSNTTNVPVASGNKITLSVDISKIKNGINIKFTGFVEGDSQNGINDFTVRMQGSYPDTSTSSISAPTAFKVRKDSLLTGKQIQFLDSKDIHAFYSNNGSLSGPYNLSIQSDGKKLLYLTSSNKSLSTSTHLVSYYQNNNFAMYFPIIDSITAY